MIRGEFVTKNCVYGYVKTKDNKLEIDPVAADTVRLIFSMAAKGKSIYNIVKELYYSNIVTPSVYKNHKSIEKLKEGFECVWSKSLILKILRNEQYIGTYIAGKSEGIGVGSHKTKRKPESEWIRIPEHHPPIISKELFETVNKIINNRAESLRNRKNESCGRYERSSPLKGKVVCGCCGHVMTMSLTKNSAFHCAFTRNAPDERCYNLKMLKSDLEKMVLQQISKQAKEVLRIGELEKAGAHEICRSECDLLIESANGEKRKLYESFVLGKMEANEYTLRKAEIDGEIDRLNRKNTILGEQFAKNQSETNTELSDDFFKELSPHNVEMFIEKVLVYPDKEIRIEWKIAGLKAIEVAL